MARDLLPHENFTCNCRIYYVEKVTQLLKHIDSYLIHDKHYTMAHILNDLNENYIFKSRQHGTIELQGLQLKYIDFWD